MLVLVEYVLHIQCPLECPFCLEYIVGCKWSVHQFVCHLTRIRIGWKWISTMDYWQFVYGQIPIGVHQDIGDSQICHLTVRPYSIRSNLFHEWICTQNT